MRLLSLQLENFRQFFGETPHIKFSSTEQYVTVIHGSNGAGKTALLNALTWALFGTFTRGFQYPDQLVNKRAIREANIGANIACKVLLEFEHNERHYRLEVRSDVEKIDEKTTETRKARDARLQWSTESGVWNEAPNVSDAIGKVLPEDLHSYFFFDGERIERIVSPTREEKADLSKATRKLLGVTILERAERHLNGAKKDLEKELQSIGDAETKKFLAQKSNFEKELDRVESRQRELQEEIDAAEDQKKEISKQLSQLEEVKDLQLRRDRLSSEQTARKASLRKDQDELKGLIASSGYSIFVESPIETFKNLIDNLREKGELPAGIKKQFVTDLLEQSKCICGRLLDENFPEARRSVEEWQKRAGLADVEEKAIRMGGEIISVERGIPVFWDRLDGILEKKSADRTQLSHIEEELERISIELQNSPREEISALEGRLKEIERKITECTHELGASSADIRRLQGEIQRLDSEISRHEAAEERQQLIQRQINAANDARQRLFQVKDLVAEDLRSSLSRRIKRIFHSISVTPYTPELADDFSVTLHESAGGSPAPVAGSTGESQILSFSFIGGLIDEARDFQRRQNAITVSTSCEYPIVMDSPFGSLDPEYRTRVCEHLNKIADQVVLMVTKTQWRGEVEQALRKKIGRSYVLTYYTPREDLATDDQENRNIELGGSKFDLVKESPNGFEYTEICEVSNG
jgi:DNA sulfur modification protein DndD